MQMTPNFISSYHVMWYLGVPPAIGFKNFTLPVGFLVRAKVLYILFCFFNLVLALYYLVDPLVLVIVSDIYFIVIYVLQCNP